MMKRSREVASPSAVARTIGSAFSTPKSTSTESMPYASASRQNGICVSSSGIEQSLLTPRCSPPCGKRQWMRIMKGDVGREGNVNPLSSQLSCSEPPINERRVERRQHQQREDEQRQRQRDQHVRQQGFHRATPNISASIFCAFGSGSMNGTQPRVTQKNVKATLAARTRRPSYQARSASH